MHSLRLHFTDNFTDNFADIREIIREVPLVAPSWYQLVSALSYAPSVM